MGIKSLVASRLSRISGGLVLVLLLAAGGYSWVQTALKNARIATTNARLTRIGLALRSYLDEHRTFPPAVMLGPGDVPWHGWRVPLLPYLGEEELADQYRMDERWDSPANRKLIRQCPEVFQLPTSEVRTGFANACAVVGKGTAWPAQQRMRIRDFKRGLSNALFVVDMPAKYEWTNPRDMTPREFFLFYDTRDEDARNSMLMGDGTLRSFSRMTDRKILVNLMAANGPKGTFRGDNWPVMFNDAGKILSSDGGPVSSLELDGTTFHASWNEGLGTGKNEIWCAVFQMCWDNLNGETDGPVASPRPSAVFNRLNSSTFDRDCLDSDSYLLFTGDADAEATADLRRQIEARFPNADPKLPEFNGGTHIRLYGCLEKSIRFSEELSPLDALSFRHSSGETPVETFGKESKRNTGRDLGSVVFEDTVHVGDYVSDDDFIIVLRTEGGREDEIILAKIAPEASLRQSWLVVTNRLAEPHRNLVSTKLREKESLRIPVIDFNVDHSFEELTGHVITNVPGYEFSRIVYATETIKFHLDEYGADLLAQADIVVLLGDWGDEPEFDPEKPRHFVFDQPFLLALREKSASQPYLLCWVAHPDILIPDESE